MRKAIRVTALGAVLSVGMFVGTAAACSPDSVQSGTVCMDKYEASVWYVPPSEKSLISSIQKGAVTLADLTAAKAVAVGVVQLGLAEFDLEENGCPKTGNGCVDVYAVSIPGVTPSTFIRWYQAAAAARNSGKRLPTNQEWQVAAFGTPDTGGADNGSTTCNTDGPGVNPTGSRSACVSDVGAFDMVGNVWEWVADWGDIADGCTTQLASFGGDVSCVGGPGSSLTNGNLPGAFSRGGDWNDGTFAGVFAVRANGFPQGYNVTLGFRSAR